MRRMTGIVITMAAGLMLAGCSGQAGGTGAPAVVSSPSPSTLTMAQAVSTYQRISGSVAKACSQFGAATQRLSQSTMGAPVPANYHALAAKCRTAWRASLQQMAQTAWPPKVQPVANEIVTDYSRFVAALGSLAQATTAGQVVSILMRAQISNAAAEQMRIMLGLPAAPTPGQG